MRNRMGGFALSYIFIAAALMAVLGGALAHKMRSGARGEFIFNASRDLTASGKTVLERLRLCPLQYPAGSNGTGFNVAYPGATVDTLVSALICPGAPAGQQGLWNGTAATFLPMTPRGYTGWTYRNDAAGIRAWMVSDGSGDRNTALTLVARNFGGEAVIAGNTLTLWIRK